jgi:hypothetical protein
MIPDVAVRSMIDVVLLPGSPAVSLPVTPTAGLIVTV